MDRSPVLRRLDALIGEWEMQAVINGQTVAGARMLFEWIEDGAFVAQRAYPGPPLPNLPTAWAENSPLPTTVLIGLDDTAETFTMLYSDARGVLRVYAMTLADNLWTMHRAAVNFHQRFTATLSENGKTIAGRWEGSADGTAWDLDFEVTYSKIG